MVLNASYKMKQISGSILPQGCTQYLTQVFTHYLNIGLYTVPHLSATCSILLRTANSTLTQSYISGLLAVPYLTGNRSTLQKTSYDILPQGWIKYITSSWPK